MTVASRPSTNKSIQSINPSIHRFIDSSIHRFIDPARVQPGPGQRRRGKICGGGGALRPAPRGALPRAAPHERGGGGGYRPRRRRPGLQRTAPRAAGEQPPLRVGGIPREVRGES